MMSQNNLGLDLNEIIKSAYSTFLEVQQATTEMIGTDCLWARATPVINSEDIILLEYTLTLVGLDCPKPIRVVIVNTDYNPGEYTIDLYGLGYVQPLEINITILEWSNTFGNTTMPLKGDVLYMSIYHKLFEVLSSELVYSITSLPTYYKIVLSKYTPSASRQETDEFRQSIEDLTVTLEELFGDLISQEVADNNATVETTYNNTTYVDPVKEFDIDSIITKLIKGENDNLISNAYYDFSIMNKNITYHTDLIYETSSERNHLIYSCWCMRENDSILTTKIKSFKFFTKDIEYWYFRVGTTMKLEPGDEITITRGSLLKVNGIIATLDDECSEDTIYVAIRVPEMNKSLKKLTKWYENTTLLKIYKTPVTNLLRGYDEDDKIIFYIKYKLNQVILQVNNKVKYIPVELHLDSWNYFMIDISPDKTNIIIELSKCDEYAKVHDYMRLNTTIEWNISDFTVHEFRIENMNDNVLICNIRLYENEYEMGDNYKLDKYSPITQNASKLILVDSPNVPNKEMFVATIK